MSEIKEVKNNVKWTKNGLAVGYGYNVGEEGYVDPKAEITIREENKENKVTSTTHNTLEYLLKKDFVEKL